MKKPLNISFISICFILICGCEMLTRSPAEKSTDPKVIAAVAHADAEKARAQDTSRLVTIGSIALIAGIAIRFASNSLLPKSTGIGIGVAAGGAGCIGIARFDPALQVVAVPVIVTVLAGVGLWVASRVYYHFKKNKEKSK